MKMTKQNIYFLRIKELVFGRAYNNMNFIILKFGHELV